ncbi:aldehyde dehydrogenase family protein [Rhodococcus sp. NPDC058514]|uniref:aldehyde dehydrogenase family protein n=1 Tax=unclassified Rhodococcus (in: high G+C Gram-positive bacteria) TaxID=192944 RepID=UPI0036597669
MGIGQDTDAAETTVEVAAIIADLRRVYATGRTRGADWRIAQLEGIERLVIEREDEFAQALATDLGCSAFESWMLAVTSPRAEAAYARARVRRWMRRRLRPLSPSMMPALGWIQYEPLGVVLIVGPWNGPVNLVLNPLVAAVAAGNCAVVKPSELTPATSRLLARLIPEYLDPGAVAVVEGDGTVTQDALAQGVDHCFFTGGTEIGRKVMAAAAPHLTPVTLELGGKSPVIVTADADLDVTARRIVWAKLLNSGQVCIAPDYVLAERSVRDDLVARLVGAVGEFRADAPVRGLRVIDERHFDRLATGLASTRATVAVGGGTDRASLTIEPTVLVDPEVGEPLMTEEIFGPILPVLAVDSLDEAIAFVTARPKPLAAYLFTRSGEARRRVLAEVSAGGIVVNHLTYHYAAPQLPFGGVGASGMGQYTGKWGFEALSHRKAVLVKPFKPDPRFAYPPYSDRAIALMRRLF